ncbi:MAG: hypothetical protein A4E65_00960 [Syntrophorhabdus sp. PtaU1.Bin153]|nr:MAG: hypothetical protein A4E65_00960 [Syntrophorhabdus sp. PtaU1.Bin153]
MELPVGYFFADGKNFPGRGRFFPEGSPEKMPDAANSSRPSLISCTGATLPCVNYLSTCILLAFGTVGIRVRSDLQAWIVKKQ